MCTIQNVDMAGLGCVRNVSISLNFRPKFCTVLGVSAGGPNSYFNSKNLLQMDKMYWIIDIFKIN